MNILFVTSQPFLNQLYGGANFSVHQLCCGLRDRGHKVSVLAGFRRGGWFERMISAKMRINSVLNRGKCARDMTLGYPTWRCWEPVELVPRIVARTRADVVVVGTGLMARMASAVQATGIPIVLDIKDPGFAGHGGDLHKIGIVPSVANSRFSAQIYHDAFGLSSVVIHPLIDFTRYQTITSRENVVFINPVPEKGRALALKVARLCPEIPFSFVLGWPMSDEERAQLDALVAPLPNIAILEQQTDMREVYKRCRVLLVPSLWKEAYGRVVTEAQISGIPVIASNRYGLPEAVGAGGVLLDPESPASLWADALRLMWRDRTHYSRISDAAKTQANRKENTSAFKIPLWENTLRRAIADHRKQT